MNSTTSSSNNEGNTNGSMKKGAVAATHSNTNPNTNSSSSSSSTPNRPVLTKRSSALNNNSNSSTAASAAIPTRSPRIRTSTKATTTMGTATTSSSSGAVFNPLLIFYQIMALQFFHYFILTTFLQINRALFGTTVTLDRIFTANYLNLWNKSGWVDNGTILLSFLMGAILLALIVEKAKKCLDFAVTLFIIHLMICVTYIGHFPISWDWWILHISGTIIMIVLGEFLCSRRELMEIPLLVIPQ